MSESLCQIRIKGIWNLTNWFAQCILMAPKTGTTFLHLYHIIFVIDLHDFISSFFFFFATVTFFPPIFSLLWVCDLWEHIAYPSLLTHEHPNSVTYKCRMPALCPVTGGIDRFHLLLFSEFQVKIHWKSGF